jgi:hypothetical protein
MKNYVTSLAPLAVLFMLACDSGKGGEASSSAGVDGDGDDGWLDGTSEGGTGESPGDGDCSLEEFVPRPYSKVPDWTNTSGLVNHEVSHGTEGLSAQLVDARFFTTDYVEDSELCIESIVEPTGVDSCWVWYSRGQGSGSETPDYWYDDLPVETISFDVGEGPIALDVTGGNVNSPSWYSAELPQPPAGVPFGGTASLAATFDGLPAIAFDLDVPNDILPLGHPLDTTTLSSEELASWTWATPGGDEPVDLEITVGGTPPGSGWSEWAVIRCQVTDDGEFAFPVEYLDLVRERLGPELHARTRLTREATGTKALADKLLHWRSSINAELSIEVVD